MSLIFPSILGIYLYLKLKSSFPMMSIDIITCWDFENVGIFGSMSNLLMILSIRYCVSISANPHSQMFYKKKCSRRFWKIHRSTPVSEHLLVESLSSPTLLTPFRMGFFGAAHGCGEGAKRPSFPKIFQTYSTIMKFGTVIPYLKKFQKQHELYGTLLGFRWHQHLFTRSQQILLYQEIQI